MSTPDFRLRQAVAADAAALATLGARLFEQTFAAVNTAEDMRIYIASAFSVGAVAAGLADEARVVWIASDLAGNDIGYAALRRGRSANGVTGERPAEIQRIYADKAWHGRGVGHALMQACIEQARTWGCDVIWLAVWEMNPRAISFYEKLGFLAKGRQTFVLGADIQRDLVMVKGIGVG